MFTIIITAVLTVLAALSSLKGALELWRLFIRAVAKQSDINILAGWREAAEALEVRVVALESEIATLKAAHAEDLSEIATLKAASKADKETIATLQAASEAGERTIAKLTEERDTLLAQVNHLTERVAELERITKRDEGEQP